MQARTGVVMTLIAILSSPSIADWVSPFISEIHYDNAGRDTGEFVGLTVPSGLSLDDWSLVFYNGSNGAAYATEPVFGSWQGVDPWGELVWPLSGVQNGPDAVALVSDVGSLVDFVAYEGAFAAIDGPAAGSSARLIPVFEDSATPPGHSLQRVGAATDWSWIAGIASPGTLNAGLSGLKERVAVALPGVHYLMMAVVLGWIVAAGRGGPGSWSGNARLVRIVG